jgi:hypothetical protein
MLKNNDYNIDSEFDYASIKSLILKSLQNITKEEALKKRSSDLVFDYCRVDDNPNNIKLFAPPTSPLLKLKIRNTTQYLTWRIAVLNRGNFTCQVCHTSMKDNKKLRLEVHHSKSFNDICKDNNISTVEQALECKELWKLENGICICYSCHKDVEKIRTKLRNMFLLKQII